MNSKTMSNWSGILLLIAVCALIYEIFADGFPLAIFYFLIVSTVFNVGSAIMKKLESFEAKINE